MANIPSFRTWVSGEVVTAAYFNTNVRDAGNFFLSWPVCELRQTVGQSVANGNTTVGVAFDTEDIDTDNMHSTVTNTSRATCQTAGRYQRSGGIGWLASSANRKGGWWLLNGSAINGSAVIGPSSAANPTIIPMLTTTMTMNVSDFLELMPYQESGGAVSTSGASFEQSTMSVRMVGTI